MNVNSLRSLCIEIFKTLDNISPAFMNQIFQLRKTNKAVRNQRKINVDLPNINQVFLGAKSIRYLGPKIWNSLPVHMKSTEILTIFKRIIKHWDTVLCKCSICQHQNTTVKINKNINQNIYLVFVIYQNIHTNFRMIVRLDQHP